MGEFNREVLAIDVDFNLPAARVVRTLERIAAVRGYPLKLRLDNGPELISMKLAKWAEQYNVLLEFIKTTKAGTERVQPEYAHARREIGTERKGCLLE